MPRPSASLEERRVNSAAVITNPYTQLAVAEGQFDLNLSGVCRSERIHDGLTRDPVHFVADDRVQRSGSAFREHPQLRI
jgi:hypothetical protein